VLEDEHELVLGVDNIVEGDNVLVLELLHERDFADGGGGRALFRVEVDFFEGDEFAGLPISTFKDLWRLERCRVSMVGIKKGGVRRG
jgi:hypothetical protein